VPWGGSEAQIDANDVFLKLSLGLRVSLGRVYRVSSCSVDRVSLGRVYRVSSGSVDRVSLGRVDGLCVMGYNKE
jgi:hypothetical protein